MHFTIENVAHELIEKNICTYDEVMDDGMKINSQYRPV